MIKKITVELELEITREDLVNGRTNNELIKNDLECEIGCCWNGFDIKDIVIEDVMNVEEMEINNGR